MVNLFKLSCVALLVFAGFTQGIWAIPAHPGTYDPVTLRFYETGEPIMQSHDEPAQVNGPAIGLNYYPVLFICGRDESITFTVEEWSQQIYTVGTHPTGSIRDYYRDVSNETFDMDGEVRGWYYSDYDYSHYTNMYGMNGGAAKLVAEAVDKAEAEGMDWTQYDNDGDGVVDCVNVIHQGRDAASGGQNQIWSHKGQLSGETARTYDGVQIKSYTISAEKRPPAPGIIEPIGTFCHEFGHGLGLPDLYDVNYSGKDEPITDWCLMSSGCFLGSPTGATPGHFCGWSKMKLGFVNPVVIDGPGTYTANASCLYSNDSVFIIPINGSETEYFTIENRFFPAGRQFDVLGATWKPGLLIYHSDDKISWSNDGNVDHWMTVVEDAQCQKNADDHANKNNADAAFAVENGFTEFTQTTNPDSNGYTLPSGVMITQISSSAEAMTFNVFLQPTLVLNLYQPKFLGNKTYEVSIYLNNISGGDALNVQGILQCDSPNVVIDDNNASFGNIAKNGGTGSNASNPFLLHATGSAAEIPAFHVLLTADNGYSAPQITFGIPINPERILLVDNDAVDGNPGNIEQFYQEALDALSLDYQTWEVYSLGAPSAGILGLFDLIIYECGAYADTSPQEQALDEIALFLDQGGDLFLSGHEFIYAQHPYNKQDYKEMPEGGFVHDYLKITNCEQDEYFYEASGVPGSMFDGLTYEFIDVFSGDPTGATSGEFQWWPDELVLEPATDVQHAEPVLLAGPHDFPSGFPPDSSTREDALPENNMLQNAPCAMIYQGEYRLFFMSVPVEGIAMDAAAPLNRTEFMRRVLDWFGMSSDAPGVDIDLNQSVFHAGDPFDLTLRMSNPTNQTISADLYILLECYGLFYYYPGWGSEIDSQPVTLNPHDHQILSILSFDWPAGVGSGSQTRFWTALLSGSGQLLGNYDFCPMSWE